MLLTLNVMAKFKTGALPYVTTLAIISVLTIITNVNVVITNCHSTMSVPSLSYFEPHLEVIKTKKF